MYALMVQRHRQGSWSAVAVRSSGIAAKNVNAATGQDTKSHALLEKKDKGLRIFASPTRLQSVDGMNRTNGASIHLKALNILNAFKKLAASNYSLGNCEGCAQEQGETLFLLLIFGMIKKQCFDKISKSDSCPKQFAFCVLRSFSLRDGQD